MDRDQAFEPVYYEYYPKIFRYIHKRLSSYHEAEDLTQEILIACYRNFDRYDPKKASLATWIYVIANNRLRNYYRDKKPEETSETGELPEQAGEGDLLERAVLLEEAKDLLFQVMETLPERDRELIRQRYFEGRQPAEIAGRLGMTPVNVRVSLNRALAKVRARFQDKGYL